MASAHDIEDSITKAFGANDESATVTQFLTTGYPELDYALASRWDGGLAVGRVSEISGPPSSGKTAIATWAMSAAQKMGGIAGFCDHERSFSTVLGKKLGLDVTPGKWIYKKPMTYEESLELCLRVAQHVREKKLIPNEAPIAWTFDSLAAQVPRSVLFDKDGNLRPLDSRNMNDNTALSRATSASMPAFSLMCEQLNIAAIFLNQIRTKIGVMYGDPRTTPGGEAPKFYASQRIMLGSSVMKIKNGPVLGNEITANVIKNKVARPFLTAKFRFVFQEDGTGKFDLYRSLVDFLVREKALKMAGAYIEWEGSKIYADPLAKKLEAAGEWQKLMDLLPKKFMPEMDLTAMALGADKKTSDKEDTVEVDAA